LFNFIDAFVSFDKNENHVRTEDILNLLNEHGSSIALILLSGVQYFTGQLFDISTITRAAQQHVNIISSIVKINKSNVVNTLICSGVCCRLGSCSCYRQRAIEVTRLECRLCCLVYIQVLEFKCRMCRRFVHSFESFRKRISTFRRLVEQSKRNTISNAIR
jgi:hypothetical protein